MTPLNDLDPEVIESVISVYDPTTKMTIFTILCMDGVFLIYRVFIAEAIRFADRLNASRQFGFLPYHSSGSDAMGWMASRSWK